ncbi:hypothetical protein GR254_25095, partial [Mycobacterium tuberculosis]|nr:hypothetical protein [Mycobacterium tuberculosis]
CPTWRRRCGRLPQVLINVEVVDKATAAAAPSARASSAVVRPGVGDADVCRRC